MERGSSYLTYNQFQQEMHHAFSLVQQMMNLKYPNSRKFGYFLGTKTLRHCYITRKEFEKKGDPEPYKAISFTQLKFEINNRKKNEKWKLPEGEGG